MRLLLPLLVCIALAGCQGEVGPSGPAGPAGPPGPTGNANVRVVTFTANYTVPQGGTGTSVTTFRRFVSEITQSVYVGGAVLTYVDVNGFWAALPITIEGNFTPDFGLESLTLVPTYGHGLFEMIVRATGFEVTTQLTDRFRLVIFDGPPGGALRGEDPPPYEEVAARFGLPAY